MMIQDLDLLFTDCLLQLLCHIPRCIRSHTGPPVIRIVIRLISYIFPVDIVRKWHPKLYQLKKPLTGQRRLTQGMFAVHAATIIQHLRQLPHTVRCIPGQRQLIVCLLIGACITRGSPIHILCHERQIPDSILKKPVRGIQSCRT